MDDPHREPLNGPAERVGERPWNRRSGQGRSSCASEIAFLPATELLKLYRERKLSPVEATEAALRQIELYNPRVNAYRLVDAEQALARARESK